MNNHLHSYQKKQDALFLQQTNVGAFTSFFNTFSAIGAIVFIILSFFLLGTIITKKENGISRFVAQKKVAVIFFSSLIAMIGSLIYSLVIGFPPCDLCWYQRIFMYPVVFLTLYDLFKKQSVSIPYTKILTGIGFFIALFHTVIYYTGVNPIPCSATASCTARYVFEFGFVTIPLMALSIFVFILLALFTNPSQKTNAL